MECWNLGMMGLKKPVFKTAQQENSRKKYLDSNKL
jgi:hypothetical protein